MRKQTADSSAKTIPGGPRHRWPILGALLAAGPVCYGLGLWAASLSDGRVMSETVCFDPALIAHFTPTRLSIAVATVLGALTFLFATPWLLGTLAIARGEKRRATAGAWSLAVNSAALILVFLLLRNTTQTGEVQRGGFFVAWLAWTLVLAAWAGKPTRCLVEIHSLGRRWGPGLLIGVVSIVVAVFVFRREQFVQCFNGDGIETFELARSLRWHFLPYWEMEWVGRFGTDVTNPSLINSYWTCALQLLLGEGELATRLLYWVAWLGTFSVALHMARGGEWKANWLEAVPLALGMFLAGLWYTFYVGWYPYMADVANPGVTDALFTFFLLASLDCLRLKDLAGWVVLMLLSSLVLYAGVVMFVLTSVAALIWQPVPRRQMFFALLAGLATASGVTAFYLAWGWLDGSLSGWWPTLYADYVDYYIRPVPRWRSAQLYANYFLLGCGSLPAIGLLLPFLRQGPGGKSPAETGWERTAATVTLLYLLIVLGGGVKNLHYLGPLTVMPLVLWLRTVPRIGNNPTPRWGVAASAVVPLLLCTWICWPASRPVFTLNSQLGQATTFRTNSYEEACRWLRISEISHQLYIEEHIGWYIGQHTWIHYSQLDEQLVAPRPLVVTLGGKPSPDYTLLLESEGVKLYGRDPQRISWAKRQRPPSGLYRFPPVFQPIAIKPF